MRVRRKLDVSHAPIAKALERDGYSVQSLAWVGKGCPDLLVGCTGVNVLLEIKTDGWDKLSEQQRVWQERWKGQVATVRSVGEARKVIRLAFLKGESHGEENV